MIGQIELKNIMTGLREQNKFPQFAIILGEEGSGKKTLMREIAKKWQSSYELGDVKVDTVRQMISDAYKCSGEIVYLIPDAHKMSAQAKNAVLKVVEEPPKNVTFIMTVSYEPSLLDTLRSRGTIFRMCRYSQKDYQMYLARSGIRQFDARILSVVNNISDLQKCLKIDFEKLQKHVRIVLDRADELSLANFFKSSYQIAFKDEEDKPDLKLFFQAVLSELYERIKQRSDPDTYKLWADILVKTDMRLSEISNPAINKRNTYEMWLLEVRELREKYGNRES